MINQERCFVLHPQRTIYCSLLHNHEGPHKAFASYELDARLIATWGEQINQETKDFKGVTSTKLPRLELIPKSALESLALRFELGIERKGEGAWNALTKHKEEALKDGSFVIERLAHCIHHCYDAIAKVQAGELGGEDDAGAILFAGSVLAEWKRLMNGKV